MRINYRKGLLAFIEEGKKTLMPQFVETRIFQKHGVVQLGNGKNYTDPVTLNVGEQQTWRCGDYVVSVKRISDNAHQDNKIMPFGEWRKWTGR